MDVCKIASVGFWAVAKGQMMRNWGVEECNSQIFAVSVG